VSYFDTENLGSHDLAWISVENVSMFQGGTVVFHSQFLVFFVPVVNAKRQ